MSTFIGPRGQYESRPGRRVLVAASLEDLAGPVSGMVTLPLRLYWSGPEGQVFDVADLGVRQWLYETVLREASRPEDLAGLLEQDALVALWPRLFLPRGVRRAWEEQHPLLRAVAVAA
jgi:hypothetical protein